MTDRETHRNKERTVRCPVEGCDAEPLARGVHLHVRQTDGNGHGPQGEVPEHVTFDDLETVGSKSVPMVYPTERDTESEERRCPYCGRTFAGIKGVRIHLRQVAGRKGHPEDAGDDLEPADFPRVGEVSEEQDRGDARGRFLPPEDEHLAHTILKARVYGYIASLRNDGRDETAQEVRQHLLEPGTEEQAVAVRSVFAAILREGRDDKEKHSVALDRHENGLYIRCRGAEATLSADEALWLATAVETAADQEVWSDPPENLIEYLRDGAAFLEGELSSRHFVAKHELWN